MATEQEGPVGPRDEMIAPVVVPSLRPSVPYRLSNELSEFDDSTRTEVEMGDTPMYGLAEGESFDLSYSSETSIQMLRTIIPPFLMKAKEDREIRIVNLDGPYSYLIDRDFWGPQSISMSDEPSSSSLLTRAKRLGLLNQRTIRDLVDFCQIVRPKEGLGGLFGNMFGNQRAPRVGRPVFDVGQIYAHVLNIPDTQLSRQNKADQFLMILLFDILSMVGLTYASKDFRVPIPRARMEVAPELIVEEIEFQVIKELISTNLEARYEEVRDAVPQASNRSGNLDQIVLARWMLNLVQLLDLATSRVEGLGTELFNHLLLGLKVYYLQPQKGGENDDDKSSNPAVLSSVRELMGKWARNMTLVKRALAHDVPPPVNGTAEVLHLITRADALLTEALSGGHRIQDVSADEIAGYMSHELIRDPVSQFPILGVIDSKFSSAEHDSSLHYEFGVRRYKGESGGRAGSDTNRRRSERYDTLTTTYIPIAHASTYLNRHVRPDVIFNRDFVWSEIRDLVVDTALRDRKRYTLTDWSPSYLINLPAAIILEAAALTSADRVKMLIKEGRSTVSFLYEISSPAVAPPQWDPVINSGFIVSDPVTLLMLANRPMTAKPLVIGSLDLRPGVEAAWLGTSIKDQYTTQPLISFTSTYDTKALYDDKVYGVKFKHDMLTLLGNYLSSKDNESDNIREKVIAPQRPDLVWDYNSMLFFLEVLDGIERLWSESGTITAGYALHKVRYRAQRFFAEVVNPALTVSESDDIFASLITRGTDNGTSVQAVDQEGTALYKNSVAAQASPFAYLRNLLITNADNFKEVIGMIALLTATFGAAGLDFKSSGDAQTDDLTKKLSRYLEQMMRERIDLYSIPEVGNIL